MHFMALHFYQTSYWRSVRWTRVFTIIYSEAQLSGGGVSIQTIKLNSRLPHQLANTNKTRATWPNPRLFIRICEQWPLLFQAVVHEFFQRSQTNHVFRMSFFLELVGCKQSTRVEHNSNPPLGEHSTLDQTNVHTKWADVLTKKKWSSKLILYKTLKKCFKFLWLPSKTRD